MKATIQKTETKNNHLASAVLLDSHTYLKQYLEKSDFKQQLFDEITNKNPDIINISSNPLVPEYLIFINSSNKSESENMEKLRRSGHSLSQKIQELEINKIQIVSNLEKTDATIALLEGLYLSLYTFQKYKSNPNTSHLQNIFIIQPSIDSEHLKELENLCHAVYLCRDMVNEPSGVQSAIQLAENILKIGKEAGFDVEIIEKEKLKTLKMNGLLAVNSGSKNPPTFSILEYKPESAKNSKPIILVGKGVVFDTGGLSLKTASGMEEMKADMAGAAVVTSLLFALAKNKLPLHVIGLIPATDNRPGENAIAPGDVITYMNGKTVEVLNTDAEGRLILADALCYASRYNPELVIDLATLTGSAVKALGKEAIAMMGSADKSVKFELEKTGHEIYERLVELPLWNEYNEQILSDVADLKNIGSEYAGAITAGKFLEHFTDYPWIHLDIAGVAYLSAKDHYRSKYATGIGVRLIYNFLKKQ
jgi:leucyl aminopeptidase